MENPSVSRAARERVSLRFADLLQREYLSNQLIIRVSFVMRRREAWFMRCSNCGICCERTEMELSSDDVKRLEKAGFRRDQFSVLDDGIRLRNVGGWCYFYVLAERKCRVYRNRPLGCRLYPLVFSDDEGVVVVDELCPMGQSVSELELRTKGSVLRRLLRKIDDERGCAAPKPVQIGTDGNRADQKRV